MYFKYSEEYRHIVKIKAYQDLYCIPKSEYFNMF